MANNGRKVAAVFTDNSNAAEAIHQTGGCDESGYEGHFTDQVLEEDFTQVDVVVEIERTEGVHGVERVVEHVALVETVREEVGVDKDGQLDGRVAEETATGLDVGEGNLLELATVEDDVVEDELLEADVDEVRIDVDHVLDGLVELDVGVGGVGDGQRSPIVVFAFEEFDVLREPQRQSVEAVEESVS